MLAKSRTFWILISLLLIWLFSVFYSSSSQNKEGTNAQPRTQLSIQKHEIFMKFKRNKKLKASRIESMGVQMDVQGQLSAWDYLQPWILWQLKSIDILLLILLDDCLNVKLDLKEDLSQDLTSDDMRNMDFDMNMNRDMLVQGDVFVQKNQEGRNQNQFTKNSIQKVKKWLKPLLLHIETSKSSLKHRLLTHIMCRQSTGFTNATQWKNELPPVDQWVYWIPMNYQYDYSRLYQQGSSASVKTARFKDIQKEWAIPWWRERERSDYTFYYYGCSSWIRNYALGPLSFDRYGIRLVEEGKVWLHWFHGQGWWDTRVPTWHAQWVHDQEMKRQQQEEVQMDKDQLRIHQSPQVDKWGVMLDRRVYLWFPVPWPTIVSHSSTRAGYKNPYTTRRRIWSRFVKGVRTWGQVMQRRWKHHQQLVRHEKMETAGHWENEGSLCIQLIPINPRTNPFPERRQGDGDEKGGFDRCLDLHADRTDEEVAQEWMPRDTQHVNQEQQAQLEDSFDDPLLTDVFRHYSAFLSEWGEAQLGRLNQLSIANAYDGSVDFNGTLFNITINSTETKTNDTGFNDTRPNDTGNEYDANQPPAYKQTPTIFVIMPTQPDERPIPCGWLYALHTLPKEHPLYAPNPHHASSDHQTWKGPRPPIRFYFPSDTYTLHHCFASTREEEILWFSWETRVLRSMGTLFRPDPQISAPDWRLEEDEEETPMEQDVGLKSGYGRRQSRMLVDTLDPESDTPMMPGMEEDQAVKSARRRHRGVPPPDLIGLLDREFERLVRE